MKPRGLLVVGCLLLSADSIFAQARTTAANPISGTWTGYMGQDESNRLPITLELKVDGKGAISGTITGPPKPGDIKTGTFDPKTGAVKFGVVIRGEERRADFEGTLVRDTIAGSVAFDNQTGVFRIAKKAAGDARTMPPPPPPAGDAATASARRSFTEVSGWVTRAAELVPADKYAYRPVQSVRTFGQIVAHVADAYNYYCGRAAGRNVQWSDAIEKGSTDKATLVPKLKQALDACNAAGAGTGQVAALIENVGHTSLHYGNMITYMRMLGLVPPSS